MLGPCNFGPAWALDVIILDTPRGDLFEVLSSSYGLSCFSTNASSHPDEGMGGAPGGGGVGGSSSVSVGELWLGIYQLDEVGPEGNSVVLPQD
jgi:hypothetical protein